MEDGERKVNVTKLAEIKLNEYSVLVITKTDYSGEDRIDFRVWENSPKYKGPTKKGFVLTMEKMDEFMKLVLDMKNKLASAKKEEPAAEEEKPAKKKKNNKRTQ